MMEQKCLHTNYDYVWARCLDCSMSADTMRILGEERLPPLSFLLNK